MIERDPNDYPGGDGDFFDSLLGYRVWYKGKPRKIGDLSLQELRGALIDAQNDLELIGIRLHHSDGTDLDEAREIAKRHRISREDEEELDREEAEPSV